MLLYKRSDILTFCKDPNFRIYTDYAAWAKAEYEYAKMVLDKIKAEVMASAIAELRQKCQDSTNTLLHFSTRDYPAYFPGYVYKPPRKVAPTFFTNRELRERGIVPPIQFYSQEAPYEEVAAADIPENKEATKTTIPDDKEAAGDEEDEQAVKEVSSSDGEESTDAREDEQAVEEVSSSDAREAAAAPPPAPPTQQQQVVPSFPTPVTGVPPGEAGSGSDEITVDIHSVAAVQQTPTAAKSDTNASTDTVVPTATNRPNQTPKINDVVIVKLREGYTTNGQAVYTTNDYKKYNNEHATVVSVFDKRDPKEVSVKFKKYDKKLTLRYDEITPVAN